MKTHKDWTQEETANYQQATGALFLYERKVRHVTNWWVPSEFSAHEHIARGDKIRIALTPFGLPSHLSPHNPFGLTAERITEEGKYRAWSEMERDARINQDFGTVPKVYIWHSEGGWKKDATCHGNSPCETYRVPVDFPWPDAHLAEAPTAPPQDPSREAFDKWYGDGSTHSHWDAATFIAGWQAAIAHVSAQPGVSDEELIKVFFDADGRCIGRNVAGIRAVRARLVGEVAKQAQPDPYAELKAAKERGEVIQVFVDADEYGESRWSDLGHATLECVALERLRVKPTPQREPLCQDDVPPGSVFRRAGDPDSGYYTPSCISAACGIYFHDGKIHKKTWEELMLSHEILRPGATWQPCSKEVTL